MAFVNIYRNINAVITAPHKLFGVNIFLRAMGVFVVIASLIYAVGYHRNADIKTLGAKTDGAVDNTATVDLKVINEEIKRTQAVLTARPDYVTAWIRLSVLYEQIGESNLAEKARATARFFNPDL